MPSTTIQFNDDLLMKIDEVAKERGTSRNRFILEACKSALQNLTPPEWPEGFFENHHSRADLALLRKAAAEMEESIIRLRRSRGSSCL